MLLLLSYCKMLGRIAVVRIGRQFKDTIPRQKKNEADKKNGIIPGFQLLVLRRVEKGCVLPAKDMGGTRCTSQAPIGFFSQEK